MNKHAYIAELTQLLYYMAEWDRNAAVKKYEGMLDASEDPEALMKELGSPMKLAVTLSRGYEPSDPNAPQPEPEPVPVDQATTPAKEVPPEEPADREPAAEEAAPEAPSGEEAPQEEAPAGETSQDEPAAPEEPASIEPSEPESPAGEVPPEPASEEPAPAPGSEPEGPGPEPDVPAPEEPAAPEAEVEVEAVEFRSDAPEETAPEAPEPQPEQPKVPAIQLPTTGEDAIFSEIFSAATQAQTAVAVGTNPGRPKPRPAVLTFYILACIILGVPVTLLLVVVGLLIFAIAVTALLFGGYIFTLFGLSGFPGLGNHLVILGAGILTVTAAIAIACLGVWFMRTAAIGFPRFLIHFGREHGYTQEG